MVPAALPTNQQRHAGPRMLGAARLLPTHTFGRSPAEARPSGEPRHSMDGVATAQQYAKRTQHCPLGAGTVLGSQQQQPVPSRRRRSGRRSSGGGALGRGPAPCPVAGFSHLMCNHSSLMKFGTDGRCLHEVSEREMGHERCGRHGRRCGDASADWAGWLQVLLLCVLDVVHHSAGQPPASLKRARRARLPGPPHTAPSSRQLLPIRP